MGKTELRLLLDGFDAPPPWTQAYIRNEATCGSPAVIDYYIARGWLKPGERWNLANWHPEVNSDRRSPLSLSIIEHKRRNPTATLIQIATRQGTSKQNEQRVLKRAGISCSQIRAKKTVKGKGGK